MEPVEPSRPNFRSVLGGASGVLLLILLFAGYEASSGLARLKARERQLEDRITKTEERIAILEDRIERVRSDPLTLERLAREELGLVKEGEIVLRIPQEHGREGF